MHTYLQKHATWTRHLLQGNCPLIDTISLSLYRYSHLFHGVKPICISKGVLEAAHPLSRWVVNKRRLLQTGFHVLYTSPITQMKARERITRVVFAVSTTVSRSIARLHLTPANQTGCATRRNFTVASQIGTQIIPATLAHWTTDGRLEETISAASIEVFRSGDSCSWSV